MRFRKDAWAVVADSARLGPIIMSTHRTRQAALDVAREDWLVMTFVEAVNSQHYWMQDGARVRYLAALERQVADLKTDLTIVRASIPTSYDPLSESDGIDSGLFDVLSRVRVALAGIGRVRPKIMPNGQASTSEFEVNLTVHDGEALLSVLPARINL
jgi:hypothetical protein